jgi:hypothetical protein
MFDPEEIRIILKEVSGVSMNFLARYFYLNLMPLQKYF